MKGSFSSPNYPNRYPIDQHCFWTIIAQSDEEHIFLTFGHFDLWTDPTDPENCDKGHYIQLYEGPGSMVHGPSNRPMSYIECNTDRLIRADRGSLMKAVFQIIHRIQNFAVPNHQNHMFHKEIKSKSFSLLIQSEKDDQVFTQHILQVPRTVAEHFGPKRANFRILVILLVNIHRIWTVVGRSNQAPVIK